jgi:hypothetical protein
MALDIVNYDPASLNPPETGSISDPSGSLEIEIDFAKLLSLAGIELPTIPPSGSLPPTGSLPEPPKKVKFLEVSGIVVDSLTNEPLPGVKVSNSFLKRDTTNKKGEFTIKHPSLLDTGLDPTKFPLNIKIKKYSPLSTTPYTSTGDLKPNLGIIQLKPVESDLKKEITALFAFPPVVAEEYATKDVTFSFQNQKKLNGSINDLKAIVLPLILSLIAKYGISEVQKLTEKAKIDPKAVFDEIKDVISCPTQDEMNQLINTKNKLVKKLNQTLNVIKTTTQALTISEGIIVATDTAYKVLKNIPTPSAIGGVGVPISVINGIQDVKTFLNNNIGKLKTINTGTLAILVLLETVLSQVLGFLNLLDLLTQYCYPNTEQERVSLELTALTQQQTTQTSPVVINVNGFEMGVVTEPTTNSLKRRRAIARNKSGVVMLQGEWSFSSIDQILIDELVFYIQQNDLKAD